jgi:RecA-family ATPase
MNQIKSYSIDEIPDENEEWLVDGLICPSLTLLSGQPKQGKSMLTGHCVIALINQTEILGGGVKPGHHIIGWMGYDPDWRQELKTRWQASAQGRIRLYEPLRKASPETWYQLAQKLKDESVTVFVIDHLYGMAGTTELNDAKEVYKLFDLIRPIYTEFGIAVILIAQATKNYFGEGQAGHSISLQGEARVLVQISSRTKTGARKVVIKSNSSSEKTIHVMLSDTECSLQSVVTPVSNTNVQRESPDRVREFLQLANPKELNRGWSGTGRELHRLGWSENAKAGRQMGKRWEKQNLLQKNGTLVSAGSSLIPYNDVNVA